MKVTKGNLGGSHVLNEKAESAEATEEIKAVLLSDVIELAVATGNTNLFLNKHYLWVTTILIQRNCIQDHKLHTIFQYLLRIL